jgi:hypothetical protein
MDRTSSEPTTNALPAPADRRNVRRFIDAVLALSLDPNPINVEHYLAVSRELEDLQRTRATTVRRATGQSRVA